ncbi:MAG: hypothetical protein IIB95_07690 [Candidatus Marinimicrobia bacterium]|nr:hypothetical protein [Candidatus Neomarinimicrobiota bacterium]MCH7763609.1 hypothetical protein [Candidatus Neomarinimicrobiota bacterium]
MNVYIFEDHRSLDLEPITLTRPAFEIRCGAFTCIERISLYLPDTNMHLFVRPELEELTQETFPGNIVNPAIVEEGLWLLGNVLWNNDLMDQIVNNKDTAFYHHATFVGAYLTKVEGQKWVQDGGPSVQDYASTKEEKNLECKPIHFLWEAIQETGKQLESDIKFFNDYSTPKTDATLINSDQILSHSSVIIAQSSVIDASNGPVVLDKNTVIKPMTYLEGPLYLGEGNIVASMTKFKGASSIGPVCKLGGEINNVIIQGWSNKVHDGHLGNAYLGQWVNLGAGTINSDLKNNYSDVKVMVNGTMRDTGTIQIGCFLGDHVKTAIGTLLNTGTVIGPGSNIVSRGFPAKTITSFSWCVGEKIRKIKWDAFIKTVKVVKSRRGIEISKAEITLLESIYHNKKT